MCHGFKTYFEGGGGGGEIVTRNDMGKGGKNPKKEKVLFERPLRKCQNISNIVLPTNNSCFIWVFTVLALRSQ